MKAERVDAIHEEPVWRERASFIIGAVLPEEGRSGQLWARQIDDYRGYRPVVLPPFG